MKDSLQLIHDLCIDYDSAKTVDGLKNLIDEIKQIATNGLKKSSEWRHLTDKIKVGDTIFRIIGKAICDWVIVKIEVFEDEIVYIDDSGNEFNASDIDKTVFLTVEEVAKALAERKEK